MFKFAGKREAPITPPSAPVRSWTALRLWHYDEALLAGHYKRLSDADRRIRFGHLVSDRFLENYARIAFGSGCIVIAAMIDGVIRGIAEARPHPVDEEGIEAAFTVETGFKGRGIGTGLFDELMQAAAASGRRRVVMACIRSNARMIALAAKHGAVLMDDLGLPDRADSPTLADELVEDVLCLALDLRETRWNSGY